MPDGFHTYLSNQSQSITADQRRGGSLEYTGLVQAWRDAVAAHKAACALVAERGETPETMAAQEAACDQECRAAEALAAVTSTDPVLLRGHAELLEADLDTLDQVHHQHQMAQSIIAELRMLADQRDRRGRPGDVYHREAGHLREGHGADRRTTADTGCPVLPLTELYGEATARLDSDLSCEEEDMVVERLSTLEDAIVANEAASPAGLLLQAKIIRQHVEAFDDGRYVTAMLRLAAGYAERLAGNSKTICGRGNMNVNRRATITATPAALLTTTVPALAADPDAELHRLIAEFWRLDAEEDRIGEEQDIDPPHLTRGLPAAIEAFKPQTLRGALAKLRLGFDDDTIRRCLDDGGTLDRVGYAALGDLFRIIGEA